MRSTNGAVLGVIDPHAESGVSEDDIRECVSRMMDAGIPENLCEQAAREIDAALLAHDDDLAFSVITTALSRGTK